MKSGIAEQQQWQLYGREICPLCDQAAALLDQAGISWQEIDIDNDLALLDRYRNRIPVLRNQQTGQELGWPFDRQSLVEFVGGD